jgi:hypothetical protein
MAGLTRRFHVPSALRRSAARIEPERAQALVRSGAVLVDVRRHEDLTEPLADARRIPPDEIPGRLSELRRGVPIVLACT